MENNTNWKELKNTIEIFFSWFIMSLIAGSFIGLWVVIQYGVGFVINNFELTGIDRIVLYVVQFLFAILMLAPIAITIYREIRIMVLKTNRMIKREIELGKDHEA